MNAIDQAYQHLNVMRADDPSRVIIMGLLDEIESLIGSGARAVRNERAVCQAIAARYGGRDAEAIAEMIGARSFQPNN